MSIEVSEIIETELSKWEIAFLIVASFGFLGLLWLSFWLSDRQEEKTQSRELT